jgi:lipid-A-disaccharide synthase
MGGAHLRKKADHFLYPLADVGGFGFWEPILKLPQLWAAWTAFKKVLADDRPDIVVPMDYYGFNIRVAKYAHAAKIPVAYYISPQVWATRAGRVKTLGQTVDKMLVIFPFEEEIYKKAGVHVSFVGHPLVERLPAPAIEASTPTIGLMPGSRRGTMARHLPILIETADQLRKDFPALRCILFRPEEIEEAFYKPYLEKSPWIELKSDPTYEARKTLWLAIGVSGTSSLENMLLGIPMIVMYKLSPLTYWIARMLIQVPYVGIPNLLAGRAIIPELIQDKATPEHLAQTAKPLLLDSTKRAEMRTALLSLRATLQEGGSSRAAEEILKLC